MTQDPRKSGRFSLADIRATSRRERQRKLLKDIGFILLVWLTGAAVWLVWEWAGGGR